MHFQDPDTTYARTFKGYHLDLKPENILVTQKKVHGGIVRDLLLISDFGQSEFVEVSLRGSDSSSHFVGGIEGVGGAGTEIYAPPEYQELHASETYDIWSLGIIFLEVMAYVIRGTGGLCGPGGLDFVKCINHDAKFYIKNESHEFVLKPEIRNWIEGLVNDSSITEPESINFVRLYCGLVLRMLNPNRNQRVKIDGVLQVLRDLCREHAREYTNQVVDLKRDDEQILIELR